MKSEISSATKAWVSSAIYDEILRPDGLPWVRCQTRKELLQSKRKRIDRLLKYGQGDKRALRIADILTNCSDDYPCFSGACSNCNGLLQRWLVRASRRALRKVTVANTELVAISIVPAAFGLLNGQLHKLNLRNMTRVVKAALRSAGVQHAIIGVDYSFNECADGTYAPYWSPHLYVVAVICDRPALKTSLCPIFPRTAKVRRPVTIKTFDNSAYGLSYAFKTDFNRRISYDGAGKHRDGSTRRCRRTTSKGIRASDQVELLIRLHRDGLHSRLTFLRFRSSASGLSRIENPGRNLRTRDKQRLSQFNEAV
jgi:hypothetical protein